MAGTVQPLSLRSSPPQPQLLTVSSDTMSLRLAGGLTEIVTETDIKPGVYEGGLKLWECSIDLAAFLSAPAKLEEDGDLWRDKESSAAVGVRTGAVGPTIGASANIRSGSGAGGVVLSRAQAFARRGGAVAELGCGHGLPGVVSLLAGASTLHLFDFNEEVLQNITAPNVALNLLHHHAQAPAQQMEQQQPSVSAEELARRVRYFAGDWLQLSTGLLACSSEGTATADLPPGMKQQYVLMLSADCLYTQGVTAKLCDMIREHLRYPDGVALVAAKRYYFGTGGSIAHFKGLINTEKLEPVGQGRRRTRKLRADTVWLAEDGASNIREIVRVSYSR